MNIRCCLTVLAFLLVLAANGYGADLEAGKKLADSRCSFCHGINGISGSPVIPNHRSQQPLYFVKQLKAFKDGSRQDPMMAVQAANLSEADMENIAAYYSSLSCE